MTGEYIITREISALPDRAEDAHKGSVGRLVVIGGCCGEVMMAGAPAAWTPVMMAALCPAGARWRMTRSSGHADASRRSAPGVSSSLPSSTVTIS